MDVIKPEPSTSIPGPGLRIFARAAEMPLACSCVVLSVTTLVWKTVGLGWLPGWEEMFGGFGSQYPRRVVPMAPGWALGYLLVYGVLGSAATVASVLITRRRGGLLVPAGVAVCRYARLHGLFHVVLGLHHTLWAVSAGEWGHLKLEQFEVPGLYALGGLTGFATGLHGLKLLASDVSTPTFQIVRAKIVVDGVSCLTFVSVVVCFAMNLMGLPRDLAVERVSWVAVFVGPLLWLTADLVRSRPPRL